MTHQADPRSDQSGAGQGEHRRMPDLTMPENHLDVVIAPDSIDNTRQASAATRIGAVVAMPLFFILVFTLAYVSALHAPKPHDMALTIAGPATVTRQISEGIDKQAKNGFDITRTTDAEQARQRVVERKADGAVLIDGTKVTTVVASAGGKITVPVIEQVGQQIATQLDGTATVIDVAPTTPEDASGTALFFYLVVGTVGGFLPITVVAQVLRKPRTRTLLATAAGTGILVPLIGFATLSLFVGDFHQTFGNIAAVIGVAMIYTFTIATLSTIFTKLLGQGAVFAQILFLVGLNLPSMGGSAPLGMLPPFWQVIHNGWLGSGAFETIRSIVYFHGNGASRWLLQLGIWAVAALLVAVLIGVISNRRRRAAVRDGGDDQPVLASDEAIIPVTP